MVAKPAVYIWTGLYWTYFDSTDYLPMTQITHYELVKAGQADRYSIVFIKCQLLTGHWSLICC